MVPAISGDQDSNGSRRFCLAELTEGDEFTYLNRGAHTCGHLGQVCSHDGNSVHVIHDTLGNKVCVVGSDAVRVDCGSNVVVSVGESAMLIFVPSHPLLS